MATDDTALPDFGPFGLPVGGEAAPAPEMAPMASPATPMSQAMPDFAAEAKPAKLPADWGQPSKLGNPEESTEPRRARFHPAVDGAITSAAQEFGVDLPTMQAFAGIESGGRPSVVTGSYKGLFQLSDSEFAKHGGSGNIFDPTANARAAAAKIKSEQDAFAQRYGRLPTTGELYMIHQQGVGGAAAHWAAPDAPAWENMASTAEGRQRGAAWAKRAIWGNIPDDEKRRFGSVENVTSRDFTDMWARKVQRFGGSGGQTGSYPAAATQQMAGPDASASTAAATQQMAGPDASASTAAATQQMAGPDASASTAVANSAAAAPSPSAPPDFSAHGVPVDRPQGWGQPSKLGGPAADGVPTQWSPTDPLAADQNGRIDPTAFARRMAHKVSQSDLNGQVPPWGPQFGITTGSPDEWARFWTMVQQQESGHRTAPVNPDGSLRRFSTTIPTERSFGPGQFNVGEYGLRTWADVNDPDKVMDAYINVARAGRVPQYFGSVQRPNETLQHGAWFDKIVAPGLTAAVAAPAAAPNMSDMAPEQAIARMLASEPGERAQLLEQYLYDTLGVGRPPKKQPPPDFSDQAQTPDFSAMGTPVKPRGDGIIEGLTDPQQYKEVVKQFVPGVITTIGGAIQAAENPLAKAQYGADASNKRMLGIMDRVDKGETVPEADDIMGYQQMSPAQRQEAREQLTDTTNAFKPTPVNQRTFFKAGEAVTEFGRNLIPAAPGYEKSVGAQLGQGLGSMLAFLPAAYLNTPAAVSLFAASGMGEAAQNAEEFDKKEKAAGRAGLTEQQKITASLLGIGPGTTDILPLEVLLGRLPMPIPLPLQRPLAKAIGRIGGQAFIEGVQEGGQQFLQNLIEREIYNPDKALGDEVAGNVGIGAGVGGIAEAGKEIGRAAITRMGHRGRARGGSQPEQPVPDGTPPPSPSTPPPEGATPPAQQPSATPDFSDQAIAATPPASPDDAAVLRGQGWSDADIAEMDPAERAEAVRDARTQGVTPKAGPAPIAAAEAPSAEPVKDLVAQARDLVDPEHPRQGLYLSGANLEALAGNKDGAAQLAKTIGDKGVGIDNFDGQGGLLIAKTEEIAKAVTEIRDRIAREVQDPAQRAAVMQQVLGGLTGAGTGKAQNASQVVQQVTKNGAVTRESAVPPAEVQATRDAFAAPGRDVRTVTPQEAVQRREEAAAEPFAPDGAVLVGSRRAPSQIGTAADIAHAAAQMAEPTAAQAEAGNYRKGHVKLGGLDITIETPQGGMRRGTAPDGTPWEVKMPAHYGYVKRSKGADGEQMDVYLGPGMVSEGEYLTDSHQVYVVDQVDPDTGKFDEHKALLGFPSRAAALKAYTQAFSDGRGAERVGGVTEMPLQGFEEWLEGGARTRALARKGVKGAESGEPVAIGAPPANLTDAEVDLLVDGWEYVRHVEGKARPDLDEVAIATDLAKELAGYGITLDDFTTEAQVREHLDSARQEPARPGAAPQGREAPAARAQEERTGDSGGAAERAGQRRAAQDLDVEAPEPAAGAEGNRDERGREGAPEAGRGAGVDERTQEVAEPKKRYDGRPLSDEEVDTIVEAWRYVRETWSRPRPQSLAAWVVAGGGLRDEGRDVRHIADAARERPGLVNDRSGVELDRAAQRAWDEGFFPFHTERPTINEFLDKLQEDLHTGSVFRAGNEEYLDDVRIADQMAEELTDYGFTPRQFRSEDRLRWYLGQDQAKQGPSPARETARAEEAAPERVAGAEEVVPFDLPKAGEIVPKAEPQPEQRGADQLKDYRGQLIDGYLAPGEEGSGEKDGDRKRAFLSDARGYLLKVAKILKDRGFDAHPDKKGKPGRAVSVIAGGPAVSGDVILAVIHPDGRGVYAQIGTATVGTDGGISLMVRRASAKDRYGARSPNQWWATDLTAAELADRLEYLAAAPLPGEKAGKLGAGLSDLAGRDKGAAAAVDRVATGERVGREPAQSSMLPEATTKEKIAAEAKAKERRGGAEPMDVGMFGSEKDQTDLVDMAKQAPKEPAAPKVSPETEAAMEKGGAKAHAEKYATREDVSAEEATPAESGDTARDGTWKQGNRDPDLVMKVDADGELIAGIMNMGQGKWAATDADGKVIGYAKSQGHAKDMVDTPMPHGPGEGAFMTAKGSTYVLHADGTTSRNKKLRSDPGHEGDQGAKPRTDVTYYLRRKDIDRLAQPANGAWRVWDRGDGTLAFLWRPDADTSWGTSPESAKIPVKTEPDIGLYPVELWKPETIKGRPAYRTLHVGNDIVALVPKSASAAADTPSAARDETPAKTGDVPAAPAEKADPLLALREKLVADGFKTIVEARAFAKKLGIEGSNKDIDEKIEAAAVAAARYIIEGNGQIGVTPATTYKTLVGVYEKQPNLASRTSTSVANQAYSTPLPLAYVASRLAGVKAADVVYEPTAGNGALLIEAAPGKVFANELDPARAAALRAQGFRTTTNDATDPAQAKAIREQQDGADSVIMNPPFGAVRDGGKSKTWTVDGLTTSTVDHAIALTALNAMTDKGKAVLILGGINATATEERRKGYRGQAKREFFHKLYNTYNVTDHFTVSGDLYTKQGASWPVDVVVIDGRGKSQRALPAAVPPAILSTWDAIGKKIPNADRADATARDAGRSAGRTAEGRGRPAGRDEAGGQEAVRGGPERLPAGREDNAAGVRADGDRGQPGAAQSRPASESPGAARADRDGGRTDQPVDPGRVRSSVKRESKGGQAAYEPSSRTGALDALIPVNMAGAARSAMDRVEKRHGAVDSFIAERLGYDKAAVGKYFAAEQIDAIAAAIDNIERGAAFIIGDQTGLGKGRQVAAMLRYAMRNNMVPVLVTEKPDLFGDMYRDLRDIGVTEMLGREPRMFITNTGETIPLDEEALNWKQEANAAREAGEPVPPRRGRFLTGGGKARQDKVMQALANGEPTGSGELPDVIFSTYDQLNTVKGATTPRRQFLSAVAERAMFAFDESHNAGGVAPTGWESKNKTPNRSEFVRDLATRAKGVIFSSATYAKRPDVMDFYARTDMGRAVDDPKKLPELIQRGGVPMQQVVATMLADSGQYMRRERSFEGVEYAVEGVPVYARAYEQFSDAIRAVFQFDMAVKEARQEIVKDMLDAQGAGQMRDSGVGDAGAHTTAFSSIMHNIVNQMLLAIKTNPTADRAIKAFRAGEKPVIGLASTMESFIGDFAEAADIKIGDTIELDFGDVLSRYLERTLRITIKMPGEKKGVHHQIPVSKLPAGLRKQYEAAREQIRSGDYEGLPISPIDWLRFKMSEAGLKVAEVTGRQTMIDYSQSPPRYVSRPKTEQGPAGKRGSIAAFNRGALDALILNRSGSTGVSMHASKDFRDQRRRRMILAQAEGNIDTHLQMLGRVHRTGQVIPPAYSQVAAEIPAEARPAAVLMRKMASLNANTTGARGSVFMADAVDFMNEIGDKVVAEILAEDPELNDALGGALKTDNDGHFVAEDAAKRATGRLTLLPPAKQSEFLDRVTKAYKAELAQLDALGENPLEAKTLDLQAKTVDVTPLKEKQGDGPFLDGSRIEKVTAKAQGRAMAPADVAAEVAEHLKQPKPTADPAVALSELAGKGRVAKDQILNDMARKMPEWIAEDIAELSPDAKASTRARHEAMYARWRETLNNAYPGTVVRLGMPAGDLDGVVLSVEKGSKTKNPVALSAWTVKIAVPDSARVLEFPMSKLFPPSVVKSEDEKGATIQWGTKRHAELMPAFDEARKEGRETRYIVTGNILGGYDQVAGRGRIVNYTTDTGEIRPGILMGREFALDKFMDSRAVKLGSGAQVAEFLDRFPAGEVKSTDGYAVVRTMRGGYSIMLPASRATGGKYYTESGVRLAVGSKEFEKRGNQMIATALARDELVGALDAMRRVGAVFETKEAQDIATEIASRAGAGRMRSFLDDDVPVSGRALVQAGPQEEVWGPAFQALMSGEYRKAVASEDLSTQLDILTAKYFNAKNDPPEMRAAMAHEINRLRAELGPEWMAKYAPDARPVQETPALPAPDGKLRSFVGDDEGAPSNVVAPSRWHGARADALPKAMGAPKRERPYTVWAARISPKLREKILAEGLPMFSAAPEVAPAPAGKKEISALDKVKVKLMLRQPVDLSTEASALAMHLAQTGRSPLPAGVPEAIITSMKRVRGDLYEVTARDSDGQEYRYHDRADLITKTQGLFQSIDGRPVVALLPLDLTGNLVQMVGRVRAHESVHALRTLGYLPGSTRDRLSPWGRLVGHANILGVLEMPRAEMYARMGDPRAATASKTVSTLEVYHKLYAGSRELSEMLAQEAAAHFVEMYHAGAFSDEEVAPVRDLLDEIVTGQVSGGGDPLLALDTLRSADIEAGRSMRRDLDSLGYYSHALEAAKVLKQAKGTPEQMLAMLKAAGVKDAELEATGLDRFLAEKAKGPRPEPGALSPEAEATGASRVLAETDLNLYPDKWIGKHPYERANEVAEALRKAIPGPSFDVVRSGSAAGDSAYVRTPSGDIRISDHGAHPKAGVFWQGPDDQMNPRKFVEMVAAKMQQTIDKLLGGRAPNAYGAPRPSWMSADEWRRIYDATKTPSRPSSITRDEIVRHLEENRVGLNEVVTRVDGDKAEFDRLRSELREQRRLPRADQDPQRIADLESRIDDMRNADGNVGPKWSSESLDPSNPTYRETVLHLPESKPDFSSFKAESLANGVPESEIERNYQRLVKDPARLAHEDSTNFRSGHFPEPNIVGHMMTSMVKHEGKPVYLVDQIQSDWGQKLREEGARSDAKVADLKARIDALTPQVDALKVKIESTTPDWRTHSDTALMQWARRYGDVNEEAMVNELRRLKAELGTAEAATPGHPLVNTTDQWTTTTLRRAIRQASEAGADYIAIPHGDTVLSYNPGDEAGMRGFYGSRALEGIVPKNLRKLLEKLDRAVPAPQRVAKLETSRGPEGFQDEIGKGRPQPDSNFDPDQTGFTLFRLTDAVKRSVMEQGQPLFQSTPTPKLGRAAQRDLIRSIDDALAIVRRIGGPEVRVQFSESIPSTEVPGAARAGMPDTLGGFYQPGRLDAAAVIALATRDPLYDLRTTAGHEAWHHVETALAEPREMQILEAPAELRRMQAMAAAEMGMPVDDPAVQGLAPVEIRAIAFQRYRRLREEGADVGGIHIAVRRLFERIRQVLAAVRNALAGRDYTSFEDIFERARTGETARERAGEHEEAPRGPEAWAQNARGGPAPAPAAQAANDAQRRPEPVRPARAETTVETFTQAMLEPVEGGSVTATDLYEAYGVWSEREGAEPLAMPDFTNAVADLGYQRAKIAGRVRYLGVAIKGGEPPAPPRTRYDSEASAQSARERMRQTVIGGGRMAPGQVASLEFSRHMSRPTGDEAAQGYTSAHVVEFRDLYGQTVRLRELAARDSDGARHSLREEQTGQYLLRDAPEFALAGDLRRHAEQIAAERTGLSRPAERLAQSVPTGPAQPPGGVSGVLTRRIRRTLDRVSPTVDAARVRLQDRVLPVRRLQEQIERTTGTKIPVNLDVYTAEAIYHGRAGERLTDLQDRHLEPLINHLRAAEIDVEAFGDYLYARHAAERNAQIEQMDPSNTEGSGMSNAEAGRILGQAAAKQAAYDEAAKMVDDMQAATLDTLLRSGLIDRETYDNWKSQYQHYVPLRGFEADEENPERARTGRGFDIRGPEARQALGRRSRADNPLLYAVLQAQQAIVRSEKNRVDKTLYRAVQAYPDDTVWRIFKGEHRRRRNPDTGLLETYWVPPAFVRADNIHGVKIGGKQYYVELRHPGLARAMRGTGNEMMGGMLGRVMMSVARTYSSLVTSYNPEFVISNFLKDVQQAVLNSADIAEKPEGVRNQILKDALSFKSIRGIVNALRGDGTNEYARWFEEFREAGGKVSFMNVNDIDRIRKDINTSFGAGRVRRGLRAAKDLVEDYNSAVENGVRLSTYIAMRKAGIAQDRAAFVARELTVNFNRKGEVGPALNAMYLFFNASAQGTVRLAQAITRSKAVRYAIGGIFAFGMMLDLLNAFMAGDDDDGENAYDKVKTWIKERNLVIMIPGGKPSDYIQIPLPHGYNLPYLAGQQMMSVLRGAVKPMQAAGTLAANAVDSFNPLGSSKSFAQLVAPTMLDPIVQVIENKTWYGGPIYPTKFDKRQPDSESYFSSAPWWWVGTAKVLNSWTGGNAGRPGWVDVSPEVLQHYAEFAAGGVGKFVSNAVKTGQRLVTGEEWILEDTPFLRRVYGNQTSVSRRRDFFDAWDGVDQAHYEMTKLMKAGDRAGAEKVREKYGPELAAYGALSGTQKALSAYRKQRDQITLDRNLTDAQKREKIDDIQKRENGIILQGLGVYNRAKKEKARAQEMNYDRP